jgi:hypothetical protein
MANGVDVCKPVKSQIFRWGPCQTPSECVARGRLRRLRRGHEPGVWTTGSPEGRACKARLVRAWSMEFRIWWYRTIRTEEVNRTWADQEIGWDWCAGWLLSTGKQETGGQVGNWGSRKHPASVKRTRFG